VLFFALTGFCADEVFALGMKAMFGFYSNRVGCLGSIVISVIGSLVLLLLMLLLQSCNVQAGR
jgi:hypothetical protein